MSKFYNQLISNSFFRYIPIGLSAFLIDFSLLHVGLAYGLPLWLANGISTTIAIIYSYIMHRTFTFAHLAKQSESGYAMQIHKQAVTFLIVSVIALFINEFLVVSMVHYLSFSPSIAKILTSAIVFFWNYGLNKVLTFRTA